MNSLTEKLASTYNPKMAIIVYEAEQDQSVYLEQRDIAGGKMGAGRPLSKACITDVIRTLAEDDENIDKGFHGIIPGNLLYADTTTGHTKLVWYNPPQKRTAYLVEALGIPDGDLWVPGIVYMAENNALSVFAFKGKTPKNRLYRAPFFNIYDGGKVCLGTAKAKKPSQQTYIEAIEYWEKLFWTSEFSHIIGENPIHGNLAVITKKCIETGSQIPSDKLKPVNTTIKDLMK